MKYIVKGAEPKRLTNWKELRNDNWEPTYQNLDTGVKIATKNELMKEQGYICCYCERRLTDEDSHIEHFRPQSDVLVDALDYSNLLSSCQKQLKKKEPRHCGNYKDEWFDEELLISPLDPACETRFVYTADGEIYPSLDDAAAIQTINHLNLDLPKLISLRAAAIAPFLDEELSFEEVNDFVTGYLKQKDGNFAEFWTTIRSLFPLDITQPGKNAAVVGGV